MVRKEEKLEMTQKAREKDCIVESGEKKMLMKNETRCPSKTCSLIPAELLIMCQISFSSNNDFEGPYG